MVIDGRWASVGGANLDVRSLGINRELNLVAYDEGVARSLEDVFRADLRAARRIDLATWRARPRSRRFYEILTLPLRDLL